MKVAIFTSARSEYGALRFIIRKMISSKKIEPALFVSGAHLLKSLGNIIKDIKKDFLGKLPIFKVQCSFISDSKNDLSKLVGSGIMSFAQTIEEWKPDIIFIAGDRYELFIPTIVSTICKIPIIHMGGGQMTYGVIDNQVRNAITKLAHLHLTTTFKAAYNLSKMGEEDWRIFVVGSPGIENIYKLKFFSIEELKKELGVDLLIPTILCTYHPVTLDNITTKEALNNLFQSLSEFPDFQVVFTYPGMDENYKYIIQRMKIYCDKRSNCIYFANLGVKNYLSIMKHCKVLVGNSSSGIIEAPSMRIPTVNIGNRQMNRTSSSSVINCDNSKNSIIKAIKLATSYKFKKIINLNKNPYDPFNNGDVSNRVIKVIESITNKIDLLNKKMDFEVRKNEWNKYF